MKIILPHQTSATDSGHYDKLSGKLTMQADEPLLESHEMLFCFVCFTNRCGSNFFSETLASSGSFNVAHETFNHDEVSRVVQTHQLASFAEFFWRIARADAVRNRFSAKTSPDHLVLLAKSGLLEKIIERTQFVSVERADKLGQAISLAIAAQTKKWASFVKVTTEIEPRYDFKALRRMLDNIIRQCTWFDEFFALNGIAPLYVNYESFIEAPGFFANRVATHLGVPDYVYNRQKIRTEVQRGELNEEWRSRFLLDLRT